MAAFFQNILGRLNKAIHSLHDRLLHPILEGSLPRLVTHGHLGIGPGKHEVRDHIAHIVARGSVKREFRIQHHGGAGFDKYGAAVQVAVEKTLRLGLKRHLEFSRLKAQRLISIQLPFHELLVAGENPVSSLRIPEGGRQYQPLRNGAHGRIDELPGVSLFLVRGQN